MALHLMLMVASFLAPVRSILTCGGCYIAPAYTEFSSSNQSNPNPYVYMVFTGYATASVTMRDDVCFTASISTVTLSEKYSFSKSASADPFTFLPIAASQFISLVGFDSCVTNYSLGVLLTMASITTTISVAVPYEMETVVLTPNIDGTPQVETITETSSTSTSRTSLLPSASPTSLLPTATTSNPTPLSPSVSHIHTKVTISVVIPVFVLALLSAGFYFWCRHWKTRRAVNEDAITSQERDQPQEHAQAYLQQKAELGAGEKVAHELEARQIRYEMANGGESHEMSADEREMIPRTGQELGVENHPSNLEVP